MAALEVGAGAQQDNGRPDQNLPHSGDTGLQIGELNRSAFVVAVAKFRKRQPAFAQEFPQPAGIPLRDAATGLKRISATVASSSSARVSSSVADRPA